MSKIQTNIVIRSPIEVKKKLSPQQQISSPKSIGYELENLSLQNPVFKYQLSPNVQTLSSPPNFNKKLFYETQKMSFSRFNSWNLIHLMANQSLIRPNQQQKQIIFNIKLEESEEEASQEYFQILSPPQHKSITRMDEQPDLRHSSGKINLFGINKSQKAVKPKQTGLRKLSGKAFKIVKQFGEATYKDVASRLIKQVVEDQSDVDDQKQQNNIKRRVYDALNVLIAMGILNKEGKNIAYKLGPNGQSFNLAHKQRKQKLINELQEKRKQLLKKKQYRKQLIHRLKSLNQLINRNRLANSRNPRQWEMSQNYPVQNNRIKFGFYFMLVNSQALSTMRISPDADAYKIIINRQCSIFHDLDIINKAFNDKCR